MKKSVIILTCLLASKLLFAQSNNKENGNDNAATLQPTEATKGTYLLLTEKNNGGSFTLHPGEILCVRFEDTETCTTPHQPDGPFVKKVANYSFINASSQEYLQLKKDWVGFDPKENSAPLTSNDSTQLLLFKQTPCDKKIEHEWIFEATTEGLTTLSFERSEYEIGCNGAPSPMYILTEPITFTITTEIY